MGGWTPGLRRDDDGSIEIWIGRTDPGGRHTANWLPAPADGPFALILRGYGPRVRPHRAALQARRRWSGSAPSRAPPR